MSSAFLVLVLFASSGAVGAVGKSLDVPLGECHNCEVHCFQDCTAQYYREVMLADRRDDELKQRMLRENGGAHLSARGLAGVSLPSLLGVKDQLPHGDSLDKYIAWRQGKSVDQFQQCLVDDKCSTHDVQASKASPGCHGTSLLATGSQPRCASTEQPCSQKCAANAVKSSTALMQSTSLRKGSGFPHAPVERGAFGNGQMTLDFCFKSCLAVTCGCSGAPGFEKINKIWGQIKQNEAAKEPVVDTTATWQYREATQVECAKGLPGKKVNKGLYASFGSGAYEEICTQEYFDAFYGVAYSKVPELLKKCKSKATDDMNFGCIWTGYKCMMAADTPAMPCFVRYKRDPTM